MGRSSSRAAITQPGGRPHGEADAFDRAGPSGGGRHALCHAGALLAPHHPRRDPLRRAHHPGRRHAASSRRWPIPTRCFAGLGLALLRTAGHQRHDRRAGGAGAAQPIAAMCCASRKGRPMVTFKIARTADGYAGGAGGARLAVSCPAASAWVHLQRAHHDAIMLGIGSVLADDPQLTVRLPGMAERSPIRVILDSQLRLPLRRPARRAPPREVPVWVIAAETAPVAPRDRAGRRRCRGDAGRPRARRPSRSRRGAATARHARHHPHLLGRRADGRREAGAGRPRRRGHRLDLAERAGRSPASSPCARPLPRCWPIPISTAASRPA